MMDEQSYFDGPGEAKKAPVMAAKKPAMEADAPIATIAVHKNPKGGVMFKHDEQDGMPPDEHNSVAELAKALDEKYGEGATDEAEEKVSPGVHEKAGNYLEKMTTA